MKRAFAGIFLLLIVGLSTVCKGNDEICREAEEQKGFFLKNHKYQEIHAGSLRQCYIKCTRESSCHSVNFLTPSGCQMNLATHRTKPTDFTKCQDSTYIENVSRGKSLLNIE